MDEFAKRESKETIQAEVKQKLRKKITDLLLRTFDKQQHSIKEEDDEFDQHSESIEYENEFEDQSEKVEKQKPFFGDNRAKESD